MSALAPVFLVMAAGFVLNRGRVLDAAADRRQCLLSPPCSWVSRASPAQ